MSSFVNVSCIDYLTGKIEDGHPPEKIPMPKDGVVRSTKQTDSVPALANEGPMSASNMGDDGGRFDYSESFGKSKAAGSWWSKRLQGGNLSPDPFMEGMIPGDKAKSRPFASGRARAASSGIPEGYNSFSDGLGQGSNYPSYGRRGLNPDFSDDGMDGLSGMSNGLRSPFGTNWPGHGRRGLSSALGDYGMDENSGLSNGLGPGRNWPGRGSRGLGSTFGDESMDENSGLSNGLRSDGRRGLSSALSDDGLIGPGGVYRDGRLAANGGSYDRLTNQELVNAAFGKAQGLTASALGGNNQGYDPSDGSSAGIAKGLAYAQAFGRAAGLDPGGVMSNDLGMEHVPGRGDPGARAAILGKTGFAPSYRDPAMAVAEAALAGGASAEAAAALNNRVLAMAGLNDAQSWAMQSLEGNYAPVMQEADNSYVMVDGPVVFGYPKGPPTERPVVTKPPEHQGSYGGAKNITHYHVINGEKVPYKWEMVTFPPIDEE